ncbi:cytochrome ubiquinol oxidase subunit I [Streptomyces bobili]|uniref:cytochrome ubiquinol oxidase subunit I n=1 Tax=Streptomyces bobili TaxID=67280 RepID=UPI0036E5C4BF
MDSSTVVELSRWQFAITAIFHMTFPALTVGLSVLLAVVYTVYVRTGNPLYLQIFRFWKKIFAVGFGLGVVAGTVMTFEFGLNWGVYAHAVGPIVGVTIGMEVITAFFLEAGFIGLMLYGDGRIRPRTMALASWMVAFGIYVRSSPRTSAARRRRPDSCRPRPTNAPTCGPPSTVSARCTSPRCSCSPRPSRA